MESKLSFTDIIDLFAAKTGESKKDVESFLRELLDIISTQMNVDGLVKLKDFGTFKVVDVDSRESVDVNTGNKIIIASHKKISFVPDKTLKDLVNKPFSSFEPELLNENTTFDPMEMPEENPDEDDSDAEQTAFEEDKKESIPAQSMVSETLSAIILDDTIQEMPAISETEPMPVIESLPIENQSQELISTAKEEETNVVVPESAAKVETNEFTLKKDEGSESGNKESEDNEKVVTKNKKRWMVAILLCLAALLIPVILYFAYFRNTEVAPKPKPKQMAVAPEKIDTTSKDLAKKQTAVALKDSVNREAALKAKADSAKAANKSKVAESQLQHHPSVSGKIVIVPEGYTFRLLALKYYGSKEFWAYIYRANKAKIKHPNSLKSGIYVSIPDSESLGIDANNPASVSRAKKLGEKILNEESM